jgi:hypothetical protein
MPAHAEWAAKQILRAHAVSMFDAYQPTTEVRKLLQLHLVSESDRFHWFKTYASSCDEDTTRAANALVLSLLPETRVSRP